MYLQCEADRGLIPNDNDFIRCSSYMLVKLHGKLSGLDNEEWPCFCSARRIDEMISLLAAVDKLPPLSCCVPEGVLFGSEAEGLVALIDEVVRVELYTVIRGG